MPWPWIPPRGKPEKKAVFSPYCEDKTTTYCNRAFPKERIAGTFHRIGVVMDSGEQKASPPAARGGQPAQKWRGHIPRLRRLFLFTALHYTEKAVTFRHRRIPDAKRPHTEKRHAIPVLIVEDHALFRNCSPDWAVLERTPPSPTSRNRGKSIPKPNGSGFISAKALPSMTAPRSQPMTWPFPSARRSGTILVSERDLRRGPCNAHCVSRIDLLPAIKKNTSGSPPYGRLFRPPQSPQPL